MFNVLTSVYACGSNWGSEVGMGWNWVINLSHFCQLYVITESGFKQEVEDSIQTMHFTYIPKFYYIDIGQKARKLFWSQGSFWFYHYYRKWQKQAYKLALKILEDNEIDFIHQLNLTGYREPGYLWKITAEPYVWGPVAGFGQIPWIFIFEMRFRNKLFWGTKRIINSIQMTLNFRVFKAARRADIIISATKESKNYIKKIYNRNSIVINDSGTPNSIDIYKPRNRTDHHKLKIIWVGVINARKSLELALRSLAKLQNSVSFELHIFGDGPNRKSCEKLGEKLNICDYLFWHGRVKHEIVLSEMKKADILFFTSLMEGTPNVVNEALSVGLPVICHDACGHGECINKDSGIKIPLKTPIQSIQEFANCIKYLYDNPEELDRLSRGACFRAQELTWLKKAESLYDQYKIIYERNISESTRLVK